MICTYQHAIAVVVKSIKHGYLDCFSHLHPAIGYREREREREREQEKPLQRQGSHADTDDQS